MRHSFNKYQCLFLIKKAYYPKYNLFTLIKRKKRKYDVFIKNFILCFALIEIRETLERKNMRIKIKTKYLYLFCFQFKF